MIEGILITPYRDEFKHDVGQLISGIQREYGVPITLEQQPDLADITNFYCKGAGNFWLALYNGTVVGTIALVDRGEHTGIIRKMFVAPQWRGADKGVSRRLLETLQAWAGTHDIRNLYLGTVDLLPAASRFYEKNGFERIETESLPPHVASVRMPVDNKHYHKDLAKELAA